MSVRQLLNAKPKNFVETASENQTLGDVASRLTELRIGAIVVTDGEGKVTGIISERDIVRQIAARGAACLSTAVRDSMTRDVITCSLSDRADELLSVMTARRVRHLPVIEDGELVGILSIGDVVKAKIDAVEAEKEAMESMIRGY